MISKKFGTNLGAWAFFFFGFTLSCFIKCTKQLCFKHAVTMPKGTVCRTVTFEFLQTFPANCMVTTYMYGKTEQ